MANHILIGLGGTGYKVLRDIRKRIWNEVPDLTERNRLPIRFLYIDSDAATTPENLAGRDELRVNGQDTAITPDEFMFIRNIDLNAIFQNITNYPKLHHVIGNAEFVRTCMGEVGAAAGQKRRAGRILFAANAHTFNSKINHIIQELQKTTGGANDLRIYVFTGLAGGTGSGSIVDVVAQLLVHHPEAQLEVFAMIPEKIAPAGADAGRYHANGYAALSELSALNAGAYLPSDVSTGAEHISLPHPDNTKQFGLTVYSNINRNGAVVDSYTTMPALVADAMYFRLMSPQNDAMEQLNRSFQNENRPSFMVEYKTSTRPNMPVERARTKALGSFGIKRVRYPSDRLTSHASDNIARTIIRMMLYMNFDNDRGFIGEKPAQARDYAEYLNKANLKNWKLSDADLSLSVPILETANRKIPPTFDDFWGNEVALDYDYNSAKEMGQPLQILEQYFEERYRDEFREEKGVEAYFMGKANPQVVTDSAAAIVDKIQTNLFNQWLQGQYSANDVKLITEQILALLQAKNSGIDEEIINLDNEIEAFVKDRSAIMEDYTGTGWLKNALNRSKENLFMEYSKILAGEYSLRTRRVSLQVFQKALLPKLIQRFMDLQAEVQKFVGRMEDSVNDYGVLIGTNTPEREPDLRDNMVEVADIDRLADFEKRLLLDRQKMETMAQKYRDHVAAGAGNSFSKLNSRISTQSKLESAAASVLDELVRSYHSEMMRQSPVLGLNVLEQLHEMLGDNDDAIGRFATTLVNNSEVFINLNEQEVTRNMRNTENPTQTPAAGPNTVMLVAVPNIDTDNEELKAFVEKFEIKLKQAYNASDTRKYIAYESPRPDEITIMSYQNVFPARAIDYMPFLRGKYEELTKSPNESTNIANRILLHSEGDGSELPPLFGEGEGPKGDEIIKYLFLGAALGLLKPSEDELGNKGWGNVATDIFGIESFSMLAPKFTGIMTAPGFTPEFIEQLVDDVDKALATPRHVNEKAAMADTVKLLVKNHVLPEAGSPTSPLFKRYSEKAMAALEALAK